MPAIASFPLTGMGSETNEICVAKTLRVVENRDNDRFEFEDAYVIGSGHWRECKRGRKTAERQFRVETGMAALEQRFEVSGHSLSRLRVSASRTKCGCSRCAMLNL